MFHLHKHKRHNLLFHKSLVKSSVAEAQRTLLIAPPMAAAASLQ